MKQRASLAGIAGMRSAIIALSSFVLFCSFVTPESSLAATDDRALLKRLSQQFSDASRTADAAVLARLLDDRVTFIQESGDVSTKRDITSVTPDRPTPGVRKNSGYVVYRSSRTELLRAVVLFSPGRPRLRRIFERDADGTIVGFLSRRD